MDEAKSNPWVDFWDSPWFGIGIGVEIGVFGSMLSAKWLVAIGWVIICIQLLRHDFFKGGSEVKWLANTALSFVLGFLLILIWHFLPKPLEPVSKRDMKKDITDAVTAAYQQNAPQSAAPVNPGDLTTKAEITQWVRAAIAVASHNTLSNLTNERLNDLAKQTIHGLGLERSEWSNRNYTIAMTTHDESRYGVAPKHVPLNLTNEQYEAEVQRRQDRFAAEMRSKLGQIVLRSCDLMNEMLSDDRLETWEKISLPTEPETHALCVKLKTGKYTFSDLKSLHEYLQTFQTALESKIGH